MEIGLKGEGVVIAWVMEVSCLSSWNAAVVNPQFWSSKEEYVATTFGFVIAARISTVTALRAFFYLIKSLIFDLFCHFRLPARVGTVVRLYCANPPFREYEQGTVFEFIRQVTPVFPVYPEGNLMIRYPPAIRPV